MNEYTTTTLEQGLEIAPLVEMFAGLFLFMLAIIFIAYIVGSLIYMKIAQKSGQTSPWIAWLPFGYAVICMKLRKHPWYYGLIVPIIIITLQGVGLELIGFIALIGWFIYIDMGILESFGKDKNLAFLHLIPFLGTIIVEIVVAVIAFGQAEYRDVY